ncbi:hypothetical protein TUMSATVNIG1_38660 [Vibrio nigripulchritudo]|nr:hypothetical protein TUMSATVNIG1_38660 [Vibrio nigripulchritudo]
MKCPFSNFGYVFKIIRRLFNQQGHNLSKLEDDHTNNNSIKKCEKPDIFNNSKSYSDTQNT